MNDTLIGGGIAVVSFIGSRLIDYLFLTKTHDLALKKEFFIKKLNAFEKATTYYTITHSSITAVAKILNIINNDNAALPQNVMDDMLKTINNNLAKVQQATQDTALAIELYTDIDTGNKDEMLFSRYLDILGEIGLKNHVLELINSSVATGPSQQQYLDEQLDKYLQEVMLLISELVGISSELKKVYTGITKRLRQQIKEYDQ